DRVPNDPGTTIGAFSVNLRPRALNYWLKNLRREPHNISKEDLKMNSPHKRSDEQDRATGKKPYATPQMQVYGDLRTITGSLNLMAGNDGSGNEEAKRTH